MVDDPSTGEPIRMHVASIKEGQRLVLDFTGTGDQATAPINLRPPFIEGLARNMAIRLTDRHIPLNHGMTDAVECRFRRGSLLDPAFPGPVGYYSKTLALAESVIGAVMAKASGRPALAHIATQSSIVVGYTGARRQYVQYELMYAGAPAWEGGDGFSGVGSRASYGAKFTSVEVIESEFPVDMTRFEVLPDSGGDGAFRGGPGYVREYRVRAPSRLSGGASKREAAASRAAATAATRGSSSTPARTASSVTPASSPTSASNPATSSGSRRAEAEASSPPPPATPPHPRRHRGRRPHPRQGPRHLRPPGVISSFQHRLESQVA